MPSAPSCGRPRRATATRSTSISSSSGRLEVGRVARAHGLRGEVVVDLITDRAERVEPGSVLDSDAGALTVLTARAHQGRWVVAFDGVVDRRGAEQLRGLALRAEPIHDPDALWVHELIGAPVVLADGTPVGVVAAVQENPAGDLLVLDAGALVPERFVVGWSGSGDDRHVVIDPPEGLLAL
ncbi:MAG: ribosome maturation factor RimM [Acidimicrobiales bacterium]